MQEIMRLASGGWLAGRRTYIIGWATFLTGIAQFATGDMSLGQFLDALPTMLEGLGLSALRAGVQGITVHGAPKAG
jgi:hypothetical protein